MAISMIRFTPESKENKSSDKFDVSNFVSKSEVCITDDHDENGNIIERHVTIVGTADKTRGASYHGLTVASFKNPDLSGEMIDRRGDIVEFAEFLKTFNPLGHDNSHYQSPKDVFLNTFQLISLEPDGKREWLSFRIENNYRKNTGVITGKAVRDIIIHISDFQEFVAIIDSIASSKNQIKNTSALGTTNHNGFNRNVLSVNSSTDDLFEVLEAHNKKKNS